MMTQLMVHKNGDDLVYPYTREMLLQDNKDVSFPAILTDSCLEGFNAFLVTQTAAPGYDSLTQTLREDTPALIGGSWVQVWEVRPATPEELAERKQQIKAEITDAVQARLDTFAAARGYDNIVSACSYATSAHAKYGPEGRCCVGAREATWDALFAIEAAVVAGEREMPRSYDDIAAELPALNWPV